MSTTQLNEGAGGVWTVTAPDNVTIDAIVDANGIATGLKIGFDYNSEQNGPSGPFLGVHFAGPVSNPTGQPTTGQAYPGIKLDTTVEVKNGLLGPLGGTIDGYNFQAINQDVGNNPAADGANPHPDDYAHFHGLSENSLTDASGTPNATIELSDPHSQPAAFGAPGSQLPLPAPNLITATGTIAPGATETLGGIGANNTFTLHSEDKPGPNGGSFDFGFFPAKIDTADLHAVEVAISTLFPDPAQALRGAVSTFLPNDSLPGTLGGSLVETQQF